MGDDQLSGEGCQGHPSLMLSLQPVHFQRGIVSSRGVASGPIRVVGDPTITADQEGDSYSSGGPHAPGVGRGTWGSATWTYLYVMGAD